MTTSQKTVKSVSEIQDYWYKRVNENTDESISLIGGDAVERILHDNATVCYACGYKTKGLQRCHIVPKSVGGSPNNDNIFLMCESCHSDNPDTIYPELFFNYIRNRESHFNKSFDAIKIGMGRLFDEGSETERENYLKNADCAQGELLMRVRASLDIKEHGPGLFNKVSVNTLLGMVWKKFSQAMPPSKNTVTA